ncbi:MAG: NADH-quinone oxidoreductase subunit C [Planctomycetes bacterium]|nr:NADH-quinone oxidoreductase subunit C [Planctomycetota bacterium]
MPGYAEILTQRFGAESFTTSQFCDNQRVLVAAARLFDFMQVLKTECGFDMLAELTAVDYLHYPNARDRFGVIYGLTNTTTGERVWIKAMLNDPDPTIESVYPLWKGADWLEREVYDMYGITFEGHPDLRRVLMPEEFTSFPLRKDYPLRGRGERHNFPTITRAEG